MMLRINFSCSSVQCVVYLVFTSGRFSLTKRQYSLRYKTDFNITTVNGYSIEG